MVRPFPSSCSVRRVPSESSTETPTLSTCSEGNSEGKDESGRISEEDDTSTDSPARNRDQDQKDEHLLPSDNQESTSSTSVPEVGGAICHSFISSSSSTKQVVDHDQQTNRPPKKSYHLFWSEGFASKCFGWTAGHGSLLCLYHTMKHSRSRANTTTLGGAELPCLLCDNVMTQKVLGVGEPNTESASGSGLRSLFVLATMSGSCCAIQLGLNLFSFGCAGFNTVLGPWRPFLLSLTATSQAAMWLNLLKDVTGTTETPILVEGIESSSRIITTTGSATTSSATTRILSAALTTAISTCLALLPELLYLWDHRKSSKAESLLLCQDDLVGSKPARTEQSASNLVTDVGQTSEQTLRLRVEGMGCVACVNAVTNAVNKQGSLTSFRVSTVDVRLEEGEVRVGYLRLSRAPPTAAGGTLNDGSKNDVTRPPRVKVNDGGSDYKNTSRSSCDRTTEEDFFTIQAEDLTTSMQMQREERVFWHKVCDAVRSAGFEASIMPGGEQQAGRTC
ncbi:unnamed protein product [Amoebophrya sp. A25]|nr:unnamed protein product [Amoebophrya sp. A25]|eukprot:GSA25T00010359001.1